LQHSCRWFVDSGGFELQRFGSIGLYTESAAP